MKPNRLGRRQFFMRSSLAAAGAAVAPRALGQMMGGGGGGGGMGGGGGGGGGSIDPPVGTLLRDPVLAANGSVTPGVVDVSIDARIAPVSVNGSTASLLTYNGSFIAPTIRANPGDVVNLRFKNSLPYTTQTNILGHVKNVTNVHVHGWHVSPGADAMTGIPADDVHIAVPAGRRRAGLLLRPRVAAAGEPRALPPARPRHRRRADVGRPRRRARRHRRRDHQRSPPTRGTCSSSRTSPSRTARPRPTR